MTIMNRVAAKFAMDARSDPRRIAVAYGRCARNSLWKNIFHSSFSQGRLTSENEVSVKANMSIANVMPQLQRRRANLAQPLGALALRAAGCVARIAKGITIRCTSRLAWPSRHVTAQQPIAGARAGRPSRTKCYAPPCPACHPAKPSARSCWSYSEVP